MKPKYSFIVPIYNEEEIIPEMYRRVSAVMDQMDGAVELLLIDDGSRDSSLQMLRDLHHQDDRVSYLSFARNFGHQIAVTAGLNFAKGQVIAIMDAELSGSSGSSFRHGPKMARRLSGRLRPTHTKATGKLV